MEFKGPLALDRPKNSGWFVILDDIPGRSFLSYKPAALKPPVRALLFENCLNDLPWDRASGPYERAPFCRRAGGSALPTANH